MTEDMERNQTQAEGTGLSSGWLSVLGVVLILLGIFALTANILTTLSLALVAGWMLIIAALVRGMDAIAYRDEGQLGFNLLIAFLYLVGGVLLLSNPVPALITLTMVLGVVLIVEGVITIIRGFQDRNAIDWSFKVVNGFIAVFLGGLIIIGWPDSTQFTFSVILGIYLILQGIGLIYGRKRRGET